MSKGTEQHTYDAIVIGSGISGGWAAKELCDLGVKTLVLERGRNIEHIKDYPTATKGPWEFPHRMQEPLQVIKDNPVISKCYAYGEDTHHFFVKDAEHPYIQEKPFDWIRGYQVGGKSIMWGRACQRWSDFEFSAPQRYGYAVDWPIRYADIAPWYSHVEKFSGICGDKDGLEALPDGDYLPPFDLSCVEADIQKKIHAHYKDRFMVKTRWAHLTKPNQIHLDQGRGQCQARDLCTRGCPFGGYFSSVSSTLPWAKKTGNLTIRPFSVVHSVIYDDKKGKVTGVRIIDTNTKEEIEYYAKVIFLNAACLNTNLILLNSTSSRFPNGLGNDNGLLGKFMAFQNYRGSVHGRVEGYEDKYYYGRNPTNPIIANYRNLHKQDTDYLGGFLTFVYSNRGRQYWNPGIGAELKDSLSEPGPWRAGMYMQGETIPKEHNHVRLSKDQKDPWGIPQLITSVGYDDNDDKMVEDFLTQCAEMLEVAGVKDIEKHDTHQAPGLDIHEMGGCRMGNDPKTSLLNKWNQMHLCNNVYVTDGACMTSTGNQSPSILYMAFAARAANHAAEEMKKGNI
ncbi:GMC oxidoreductase [Mucilaginibacter ginsenosidivorans]|uniref:GMC family oxidoreductase n=1 Tax=Mucilaginibacter ginsenosidivorans TaxID=398053 RepID=A0A5B8UUA9_9SPHI|nr:GMC family oxidoreductase [Mucilaginibacter ginsenosidivorans]QEC62634.1 GMC family oxidoreductase [Mucilaginibacter ginsenosidivorans]